MTELQIGKIELPTRVAVHYANPSDLELEILDLMQEKKEALNELFELKEVVRQYLDGKVSATFLEAHLNLCP